MVCDMTARAKGRCLPAAASRSSSSFASSQSHSSGLQPARLGRAVAQQDQAGGGEQHRRQALGQEDPLPAGDAEPAVQRQQMAGDRPADDAGRRADGVEHAHRPAAVAGREPAGHEERDAGEEARLGHAEQETDDDEAGDVGDQGHAGRAQAPEQHDEHDPAPRAQPGEHHVGGHLEQHVAPEERARAEAVGRGAHAQRLVHGQRGERDIEAVEHVDQVGEAEKRHETPCDLAHDGVFTIRHHRILRIRVLLPDRASIATKIGKPPELSSTRIVRAGRAGAPGGTVLRVACTVRGDSNQSEAWPMRIALIHALSHSVPAIVAAFRREWPEATLANLLDDSLVRRPGARRRADPGNDRAFPDAVPLCRNVAAPTASCSPVPPSAPASKPASRDLAPLPVLKPNEAMIEEAVALAGPRARIGLLATFAPTLASMPAEFAAVAPRRDRGAVSRGRGVAGVGPWRCRRA